ncbi:hypothetical protein [Antarctobacter sp.]|uniref:hypothetical protein n=1 Tax=Antarctobacter sp. TaxID=1872577 RepID=UPI002B2727E9|nr:hypothetical protein [Antarctobacter sp.]
MTEDMAKEYCQTNLDTVTRQFIDGDLSRIDNALAIPSKVRTMGTALRVERLEALEVMLEEQRSTPLDLGTTEYRRICIDAKFINPVGTQISGRHKTRVMRGGTYLVDPYFCEHALVKEGPHWRASHIRCGMKARESTTIAPRAFEHLLERQAT